MNDLSLPVFQELRLVQGASFSFPFFLGVPTSGYQFSAYMNVPTSGLVSFEVQNNDPQNGGLSLNLAANVTSGLPGGTYPWQFSFTDLGGFVTTWYQGTALVLNQA